MDTRSELPFVRNLGILTSPLQNFVWTVILRLLEPKSSDEFQSVAASPGHHATLAPHSKSRKADVVSSTEDSPQIQLPLNTKRVHIPGDSPKSVDAISIPESHIIPIAKFKFRSPSPPPSLSPTPSTISRSYIATSPRVQTREPSSQPPLRDPLGPSAQYPYLSTDDEGRGVYYSCRPGGPRLYDLLNTLSLQDYGVLSWYIVDREEELFETDEVLDEDKVILALWGRWIMLNQ